MYYSHYSIIKFINLEAIYYIINLYDVSFLENLVLYLDQEINLYCYFESIKLFFFQKTYS